MTCYESIKGCARISSPHFTPPTSEDQIDVPVASSSSNKIVHPHPSSSKMSFQSRDKITVYECVDYKGRSAIFENKTPDLKKFWFDNRISSLEVQGGTWSLYDNANYQGQIYTVSKGSYPNFMSWNAPNDTISSLRPT